MKKQHLYTIILCVVFVVLSSSIAWWYFSAHEQTKRQLLVILEDLTETVQSMDRAAINADINTYLADRAKINLAIKWKIFGMGSSGNRPLIKEFNRQEFIEFIGDMTGQVKNYGMQFTLEKLSLNDDNTVFTARVRGAGSARGHSTMMMRNVGVRYAISSNCTFTGTVSKTPPVLDVIDCKVELNQQADLQGKKARDALNELRSLKP